MEKSLEVDKMKIDLERDEVGSKQSQEVSRFLVTEEREALLTQVHEHQSHAEEMKHLKERCNEMASHLLKFFVSLPS